MRVLFLFLHGTAMLPEEGCAKVGLSGQKTCPISGIEANRRPKSFGGSLTMRWADCQNVCFVPFSICQRIVWFYACVVSRNLR